MTFTIQRTNANKPYEILYGKLMRAKAKDEGHVVKAPPKSHDRQDQKSRAKTKPRGPLAKMTPRRELVIDTIAKLGGAAVTVDITRALRSKITPTEVKNDIQGLELLGLVERGGQGGRGITWKLLKKVEPIEVGAI